MIPFGIPPVQGALKALMEAGNEAMAWIEKVGAFDMRQKAMGFPGLFGGATKAPFDMVADTLRGTRAIMIDMYRQPDKVEGSGEAHSLCIKQAVRGAAASGFQPALYRSTRGRTGSSDAQFKRFYWPTLKAVILGLAEGHRRHLLRRKLQHAHRIPEGSP
jgi:hypothetical protein